MSQTRLRAGQGRLQVGAPLRSAVAQARDHVAEAQARQRRVERDDDVDQRVDPRRALGASRRRIPVLVRRVEPDPGLAPHHAQRAVIVQQVEVMRRRARRSAPVVGDAAAREMRVDVARMDGAAVADERQQILRLARASAGEAADDAAGVHQRLQPARHEAVVDEDVFFDVERRVAPLQIAGAVALHALAKDQVLRPRRRADRVRLHEPQPIERARQRGRPEQAARDREAPQILERHAPDVPPDASSRWSFRHALESDQKPRT